MNRLFNQANDFIVSNWPVVERTYEEPINRILCRWYDMLLEYPKIELKNSIFLLGNVNLLQVFEEWKKATVTFPWFDIQEMADEGVNILQSD